LFFYKKEDPPMFPDLDALSKAGAEAVKTNAAHHKAQMDAAAAQLKVLLEIRALLQAQLSALKGEDPT
jgi:hypothetical protein